MSETNTWDSYLNEVEAELQPAEPELTEEEKNYLARKEINDLANSIAIPGNLTGAYRKTERPDPLHPDATAQEIAARIRL